MGCSLAFSVQSVILANAQPLSQIKQVLPETDDTTRQGCWRFGPLKSHDHPPNPPNTTLNELLPRAPVLSVHIKSFYNDKLVFSYNA